MNRIVARLCLMPALVAGLAACSSSGSKQAEENPNLPPVDYKQEILLTLTRTLDDPTNLRDAFISDPALTPVGKDERYTACVRFNMRDARHSYTGAKDHVAYFYGGHLNQLVDATPEQCSKAAYKPFPELEKLCLANKCG